MKLLKIVIISTLVTSVLGCNHRLSANTYQNNQTSNKFMSPQENTLIRQVNLQAREEKNTPSGNIFNENRDIGFASVFIRLENPQKTDANLIIKNIEISNIDDDKVHMKKSSPQEINLKPLENSEEVFHFTNKTGYPKNHKVKAVITYQIGEEVRKIESQPIDIERF